MRVHTHVAALAASASLASALFDTPDGLVGSVWNGYAFLLGKLAGCDTGLAPTLLSPLACQPDHTGPITHLGATTLVGTSYTDSGVDFYGNIPYAEPPLGDLRLRPPVLKTSLGGGVLNATVSGPICLQPEVRYGREKSEDCLTLDIYKPSGIEGPIPVMFWLCGGGFWFCGASYYNATNLVARSVERGTPVLLVSANYRLGPLGFPQGQEAYDAGILNLGVRDAITALQWVQDNIWAFGGNKKEVTAFGLSAGSIITSIISLTQHDPPYYRAAIHESGWTSTLPLKRAVDREQSWSSYVGGIPQCADTVGSGATLDCLRAVDNSSLLQANIYPRDLYGVQMFPFGPCLDGPDGLLPVLPSERTAVGHFTQVPTLAGTTRDEGPYFIRWPQANYTDEFIYDFLAFNITPAMTDEAYFKETLTKFMSLYSQDPAEGSPYFTGEETFGFDPRFKRLAAMTGDMLFQSLRREWQESMVKFGLPTWGFMWTQNGEHEHPAYLGAAHEDNNAFQFGLVDPNEPEMVELATYVMDYWLSFATSLTPNDGKGSSRPEWPMYTEDNKVLLQMKVGPGGMTTFPDVFHDEAIRLIIDNPAVFHH
ncbi:alpha/beta-hydrolase [Cylindrobasidium torrendii FP15055 ss-10]|uniref:Alpha/beta-hydrolase n=1 Tax=Cylindrobasidium torrendii FP15055 ss-10 TaxID=1314674 RepID=A0A0D7BAC5_9AGAR|nr:alpha/beta-hydrolase [Cylindrobasidium torrendii FP15055 ss-10]